MAPVRRCGGCSLCCKLPQIIDPPEIAKPANAWCRHAALPGGGCKIYESRPLPCRRFQCLWLADEVDQKWFPLQAKMALFWSQHGDIRVLNVLADEHYARWRSEPWFTELKKWSEKIVVAVFTRGKRFFIVGGQISETPPPGLA